MAGAGPPTELAKRTETADHYVREWLSAQAVWHEVVYDGTGSFTDRTSLDAGQTGQR